MPNLKLIPTDERFGWEISLDGTPPDRMLGVLRGQHLHWSVAVDRLDRDVELSTGKRLSELRGSVSIKIGDATPEGQTMSNSGAAIWGVLGYFESRAPDADIPGSPEKYYLQLFISRVFFDRLATQALAGYVPAISAEVGSDYVIGSNQQPPDLEAFKIGIVANAPCQWDNKKYPHVPVKWATFQYHHSGKRNAVDEDEPRADAVAPPTRGDVRQLGAQMGRCEALLSRLNRQLVPAAWILVVLLAYMIIRGR